MVEISAAISALKAALDLLKLGSDARDEAKIKAAISEMQVKLAELTMASLATSEKACALQKALADAQSENSSLKSKLEEKASYRLHTVKPGVFCYKFEPDEGSMTPAHYVCQNCYDKGIKSVLQATKGRVSALQATKGSGEHILLCVENRGHNIQISDDVMMSEFGARTPQRQTPWTNG